MDPIWATIGVIGFFVFLAGLVWWALGRGPAKHAVAGFGIVIGLAMVGVAFLVGPSFPLANTGQGQGAPQPGGTFNNVFGTTPALPTGCTYYQSANYVFCTVVFNSTSAYLAVQSSVAATFHNPQYLVIPENLIRTDNANTTFTEAATLTTVPTFNSLGSSPTLYSPLGYKAATSNTPGQWQFFFDQGTQASQKPTVTAPGTATNVITSSVPVKAFSSQVVGAHFSLAGGNSTSFPNAAAQAWANNTVEAFTLTYGSTALQVQLDLLGWHA